MEQQKVQISQDALYQFITDRSIKLVRLAELMGMSGPSVTSCFKHQIINNGTPRAFTGKAIVKLNAALGKIADNLRSCILTFGSEQTYTNQLGNTYDPALIEPMKRIGETMNLTALVERVLGWSERKKQAVITQPHSKAYGCISEEDVNRINAELLAVAGVLSSYEVVPDGDAKPAERQAATKEKGTRTRMEPTAESKAYPWDNTGLGLQERSRLLHERWPEGLLLFRVNNGYTAEGDDAIYINKVDESLVPFREPSSGMVTLWMDADTMERLLPRFLFDDRRVAITDMYKE